MSGGQQQRVAIARALSFSPDLLLLDEPLSALDRKLREEMQLEFRRIQQELGVTTINVTHDQREALVMSDKIVVMNDGVVQQADRPEALYRAPGNPVRGRFIGVTSMFPGRVSRQMPTACGCAGEAELTAARQRRGPEPPVRRSIAPSAPNRSHRRWRHLDSRLSGIVEQRIFEGDAWSTRSGFRRLGMR